MYNISFNASQNKIQTKSKNNFLRFLPLAVCFQETFLTECDRLLQFQTSTVSLAPCGIFLFLRQLHVEFTTPTQGLHNSSNGQQSENKWWLSPSAPEDSGTYFKQLRH